MGLEHGMQLLIIRLRSGSDAKPLAVAARFAAGAAPLGGSPGAGELFSTVAR